ncbi:EAL domain-containing protein [Xanthomonas cassavae]
MIAETNFVGNILFVGILEQKIKDSIRKYCNERTRRCIRIEFSYDPVQAFEIADLMLQTSHHSSEVKNSNFPALNELSDLLAHRAGDIAIKCQPYRFADSGLLAGAEMKVQWPHLLLSDIDRKDKYFFKILEDHDLEAKLTNIMLNSAAGIMREIDGYGAFQLIINISGRHITSLEWADSLIKRIQQDGISCRQIAFKIDLSDHDEQRTMEAAVAHLRANGIDCIVDKLCTPHELLNLAKSAPFSAMTIGSLITKRARELKTTHVMLDNLISLAHTLGLQVIAQGIDTQEDLIRMRSMQCDYLQGSSVGETLKPAEMVALARSQYLRLFRQRQVA